eukprot:11201813-Lingulodinium_polyedra.AAC.1
MGGLRKQSCRAWSGRPPDQMSSATACRRGRPGVINATKCRQRDQTSPGRPNVVSTSEYPRGKQMLSGRASVVRGAEVPFRASV